MATELSMNGRKKIETLHREFLTLIRFPLNLKVILSQVMHIIIVKVEAMILKRFLIIRHLAKALQVICILTMVKL